MASDPHPPAPPTRAKDPTGSRPLGNELETIPAPADPTDSGVRLARPPRVPDCGGGAHDPKEPFEVSYELPD